MASTNPKSDAIRPVMQDTTDKPHIIPWNKYTKPLEPDPAEAHLLQTYGHQQGMFRKASVNLNVLTFCKRKAQLERDYMLESLRALQSMLNKACTPVEKRSYLDEKTKLQPHLQDVEKEVHILCLLEQEDPLEAFLAHKKYTYTVLARNSLQYILSSKEAVCDLLDFVERFDACSSAAIAKEYTRLLESLQQTIQDYHVLCLKAKQTPAATEKEAQLQQAMHSLSEQLIYVLGKVAGEQDQADKTKDWKGLLTWIFEQTSIYKDLLIPADPNLHAADRMLSNLLSMEYRRRHGQ